MDSSALTKKTYVLDQYKILSGPREVLKKSLASVGLELIIGENGFKCAA